MQPAIQVRFLGGNKVLTLKNKKMKLQTTKKQIRQHFNTILSIGYCQAQYLLYFKKPFAYSTRAEGWACDYYDVDGVCISTGYSPTGKRVDYSTLLEFEKQACAIVNSSAPYEDRKTRVELLLNKFLEGVK